MPLHLSWQEIALRLILTLLAGALIGFDRGERGRPAGLRTTILVCLAASIAMLQLNLLLDIAGKRPDSFVVLDLMRLPLGILSGMGFIGAGAILRRGDRVQGVTTAATLWFVTVMGLCFGGGQIGLGLVALAIGFGVLSGLRRLERSIHQDRRATLLLVASKDGISDEQIRAQLCAQGFRIGSCTVVTLSKEGLQEFSYDVSWRAHPRETAIPAVYNRLAQRSDVSKLEWRPADHSTHT